MLTESNLLLLEYQKNKILTFITTYKLSPIYFSKVNLKTRIFLWHFLSSKIFIFNKNINMLKNLSCFLILNILFINYASAQPNSTLPPKIAGTVVLKTPVGTIAQANGLKSGLITVAVDTNVRVNPKYAFLAIELSQVTGSNQMDFLNGNNIFWIFDKVGKEVKIPLEVLKSVKAPMESNGIVDLKFRIPYRLKTDKNNYTIHYRWESKDKSRNMDFLTTK